MNDATRCACGAERPAGRRYCTACGRGAGPSSAITGLVLPALWWLGAAWLLLARGPGSEARDLVGREPLAGSANAVGIPAPAAVQPRTDPPRALDPVTQRLGADPLRVTGTLEAIEPQGNTRLSMSVRDAQGERHEVVALLRDLQVTAGRARSHWAALVVGRQVEITGRSGEEGMLLADQVDILLEGVPPIGTSSKVAVTPPEPASLADYGHISDLATITASSVFSPGYAAANVADHLTGMQDTGEWASAGQGEGAWIELQWSREYEIGLIRLFDRNNLDDHAEEVEIQFSNGTRYRVTGIPDGGEAFPAGPPTPQKANRVRITVWKARAKNVGFSEIEVMGR